MTDTEKKIAEIREWHDGGIEKFPPITVFEAFGVMLDELDRIHQEYAEERAAHNAHVTELLVKDAKLNQAVEALEWIVECGTDYQSINKARNALCEIKAVNQMSEQQTPDREKKIAEIREAAEEARKTDRSWVDGQDYADDVEFLLDELERLEREYAEEREKMIKALKFYANEDNWRSGFVLGRAQADGGERAQAILDEIGVTVE